jgi:hypothetical protein
MKHVFAVFPVPRSLSFVTGSCGIAAHARFSDDRFEEFRVSIRSVCSSAAAALGFGWSVWSSGALAGTVFVHAAYVPATVACVPPRPAYAPPPASVARAAVTMAPPLTSLPYTAVPIPLPCGNAAPVFYTQPVRAVPDVAVSTVTVTATR